MNTEDNTPDPLDGVEPEVDTLEDDALDDGPTEIELLKQRATMLGISFSPNIGVDTLRSRIEEKLNETKEPEETAQVAQKPVSTGRGKGKVTVAGVPSLAEALKMTQQELAELPAKVKTRVIRMIQTHEQTRLIRCQIYNNDPKKNDLRGEIITVGNKYIGTVRKFVPFGEATENGYHLPAILVSELRRRKYQKVRMVKNGDGTERVERNLVPEYTIVEMAPLTLEELKELGDRQAAAERVGL